MRISKTNLKNTFIVPTDALISACCAGVQFTVETVHVSNVNRTPAQQADMPP